MKDKIIAYLKALLLVSLTTLWFTAVDYEKAFTDENVLTFCIITGNLVIWSFYYIHSFCKVMKGE